MSYTMRLKVKRAERALERLMGVVSRRGYAVEYLSAEPSVDGEVFHVTLRVDSGHKGDVLLRQIQKLNDVSHVEPLNPERPASSGPRRSRSGRRSEPQEVVRTARRP